MAVYRSVVTITHPVISGTATNTWHMFAPAAGASAEDPAQFFTEALNGFYDSSNTLLAGGAVVSTDGVWSQIDVPDGDIRDVEGWTFTVPGTDNPLPPQDCLVVGWRTGTAGRSGRGRTFFGPLSVDVLEANGTPAEGLRSGLAGNANTLILSNGGEGADGHYLGVYSPQDNVVRAFTSAAVRNVFGVLRSRRD